MREIVAESEQIAVESFEAFYRRSWQQIHRAVAIAIRDADLAAEAVDEAMVRAYERWGAAGPFANPEGWVYRVALNWARSWLRRLKFRSVFETPDVAVEAREMADPSMHAAIRRLPRHQREVVVARYLLDMSVADVALSLQIAEGTVKSRLHRALASLKEELT